MPVVHTRRSGAMHPFRGGAASRLRGTPLLAIAIAVAGAFVAPGEARAQDDWVRCATEGRTCRVDGEALVRYGADGRYSFRLVRGRLRCDNARFGGDPAPNQAKVCEVSVNWRHDERYRGWRDPARRADGEWRFCANENELCRPPAGSTRVRYGADGRYEVRPVSRGNVMCNNRSFGDPAPGVFKQCQYSLASGRPETAGRDWQHCANEGETCRFHGDASVRYGVDGNYVFRDAANGLPCTNEAFNTDPAPGQVKHCQVRVLR